MQLKLCLALLVINIDRCTALGLQLFLCVFTYLMHINKFSFPHCTEMAPDSWPKTVSHIKPCRLCTVTPLLSVHPSNVPLTFDSFSNSVSFVCLGVGFATQWTDAVWSCDIHELPQKRIMTGRMLAGWVMSDYFWWPWKGVIFFHLYCLLCEKQTKMLLCSF